MCYYDLRISYKDGSEKSIHYSFNDYGKALRHALRLSKSCKIVYVVDGSDYRVSFEK